MAWTVIWSEEALKDLASLDNQVARRIMDKVESTISDPVHFFERLRRSRYHKLRIGDYRVLARLSYEERQIVVRRAGHRSHLYD